MTSFSVKDGVKPEKRGFQPMRKKLGEKFGVVFSLTVVVTDTELFCDEEVVCCIAFDALDESSFKGALMLSLMAMGKVVRGEPSLLIMSLRSRRVRPFLDVVAFFFFLFYSYRMQA